MNAVDLLIADHNRVRGLFAQFQHAVDGDDLDTAAALATTIFAELEVHTTIEEETFYPRVHDVSAEIGETVDEGIQEHHVVDVLMDEINGLELHSAEWLAKMTVLIENVEHHAAEEESDLFPKVRGALDADALEALGDDLEQNKRRIDAPTRDANQDATVADLRDRASEQLIPGRSGMDKAELEATVAPAE